MGGQWRVSRMVAAAAVLGAGVTLVASSTGAAAAQKSGCHVLLVGPPGTVINGTAPEYSSIQRAVDAAHSCDWVLVAPGDYKAVGGRTPTGRPDLPAGVLVTTPRLHLRGLDRNGVVVDGTTAGAPCNAVAADQDFGPGGKGLNGILVYEADNVDVENLTVCNYLHGSGDTGNEIWWNGGDGTGKIDGWGFWGSYLTATSSFYKDEQTAAQYGIFSSDWSGGAWDQTYASNFNDSGYYIGACQRDCEQWVDHAWSEYNALGYSGSNSGGVLVIANSQFDNNEDGFDTNSQNGDNPPPQNGACPAGVAPPVRGARTCWVFTNGYLHDNNNPYVPAAGSAAAGPVGTGLSLSGARNDTVMDSTFVHNGAWGLILVPYPDSGPPCTGGTQLHAVCLYDEYGDAVIGNTFSGNGFFGNPTNGDIGATNLEPGPTDCFSGNRESGGGSLKTSPPAIELLYPRCTGRTVPPDANLLFTDEAACDAQAISIGPIPAGDFCLPGAKYPRSGGRVVMHGLPPLATMANPCAGVPANPWCPYPGVVQPAGALTIGAGGRPQ